MAYTVATITTTPSMSENGARHLAIENGGRLWASYAKKPVGYVRLQVYCAYSDDGGASWTETQVTFTDTDHHFYPVIAIDSVNNIHIAFTASGRGAFPAKRGLLYMKRTSGIWGSEEEIALKNVNNPGQSFPALAIDSSDNVHVAWHGTGWAPNNAVYSVNYRKRTSGVWGGVETVSNEAIAQQDCSIAIDNSGNVHVAWGEWNSPNGVIYYKKRTTSWPARGAVSVGVASNRFPCVALDSNDYVHVVWVGPDDILYRKRTTGWQAQESVYVIDALDGNLHPSIALNTDDTVYVVYCAGEPYVDSRVELKSKVTDWSNPVIIAQNDVNGSYEASSLLWAKHPVVSGIRTNVISKAYAIWEDEGILVLFGLVGVGIGPIVFSYVSTELKPPKIIPVLEAIRNVEMAAMGRFYVDEQGNAKYESRYARNT